VLTEATAPLGIEHVLSLLRKPEHEPLAHRAMTSLDAASVKAPVVFVILGMPVVKVAKLTLDDPSVSVPPPPGGLKDEAALRSKIAEAPPVNVWVENVKSAPMSLTAVVLVA